MLLVNLSRDNDYHTQRNNRFIPMTSCNTTSAIMALKASRIRFDSPRGVQPEDHLTKLLLSNESHAIMRDKYPWAIRNGYPPNQVHGMLAWGVNRLVGRKVDQFKTDGTLQEIVWHLFKRRALIVNGRFTRYGHMVCVIGFQSTQADWDIESQDDINLSQVIAITVDDPYGNYHQQYKDFSGNNIDFVLDEFHDLTRTYNADGSKWLHVFDGGDHD